MKRYVEVDKVELEGQSMAYVHLSRKIKHTSPPLPHPPPKKKNKAVEITAKGRSQVTSVSNEKVNSCLNYFIRTKSDESSKLKVSQTLDNLRLDILPVAICHKIVFLQTCPFL